MMILKSMIEKAPTHQHYMYNLQVKEQVEMVCHMKI